MLEVDLARPESPRISASSARDRRDRSLRRAAEALVMVHPGVEHLPDDDGLAELGEGCGVGPDDFLAINLRMGRRTFTMVCVRRAFWGGDGLRPFLRMKALAATYGRAIVLVPESFIRREPRSSNALMIAGAAGVGTRLSERMKILAHLIENGGSAPLADLANLVNGADPVAAVLNLIVEGGLHLDLDRSILPSSEVHLVQPV